ncbi:MAG: hypothetical protein OEM97_09350, partial [Acidimicrobiia bacterium]|nr:hypothetical protein [Acidimicrobiia bacterium]
GRLMASTDRSPQPPDEAPEPESRESAIAGTDPYDPWTGAQDIPPPPPAPDRRRTVPGSMNAPADPVIFGQVDAEVMADDLFASGAVSYEAERRFREHYKGLVVSWRGHLVKSRPGSTIVKVGEIDDPLFGRSSITVVSDAEVRADLRTGDLVMLNGVARSINHLERTIYLDNAVVSR